MKNLITHTFCIFIIVILAGTQLSWAQSSDYEKTISISLKAGSSRDLSDMFENSVELNINGNEGDYSKNQAELILKDFFKKFPAEDFSIVHRGKSGSQILYYIGSYQSAHGNFRVLIKCKEKNDNISIYSMDFNRE
ncbi:DUF4783 domain-containing protein [Echinicola marina]|uniref:DUF4783 domain-containing protein n=1 Tax=Echinicola marina TaxID=2859768 RepID=UPI001CF6BA80|nr:DUF4783 domain-containing protein [Echinicola marina]UCS94426.1 DUF4783 domain-containing protein [Echinicola marina]